MAKIHGIAGEWARVKGMVAGLWPLFLGVFASGFAFALFLVSPLVAATVLVAALVWVICSLVRGLRHVERFFKGASTSITSSSGRAAPSRSRRSCGAAPSRSRLSRTQIGWVEE